MVRVLKIAAAAAGFGAVVALAGCSAVTTSITARLSSGLATSILNQNDPETVRQGAPAYLLMVDAFVAEDPENADVRLTAARLYASYAGAFVEDPERAATMAEKARDLALEGLCLTDDRACSLAERPYDDFAAAVGRLELEDIEATYVAAMAWATWIQANSDDWVAIADKARVEALMRRVVELDEGYRKGSAYLYLGVLSTLLPEALGGKPEEGRVYFERAVELPTMFLSSKLLWTTLV